MTILHGFANFFHRLAIFAKKLGARDLGVLRIDKSVSLPTEPRALRARLHNIKLALTNPDMAKKAISRNRRFPDSGPVEEIYKRTGVVNGGIVKSLYSTK
jgi:hypothetical protein